MAAPTVACVFGTRPEAIKMAPVVKALQRETGLRARVVVTAQHRQMLDQVLETFRIEPDADLDVMVAHQTLSGLTARLFEALGAELRAHRPDAVLVHGDTTSTMVGALAAFYERIPVGHVEAGLRTRDIFQPFPEEVNRGVVAKVARWNFAPTELSRRNLRDEAVDDARIVVTGNTIVDALGLASARLAELGDDECVRRVLAETPGQEEAAAHFCRAPGRLVLVTGHRRENFGGPLRDALGALRRVAEANRDARFIYPVHLNPNVQQPVREILAGLDNFLLLPPLSYVPFLWLLTRAYCVVTDSGGIQEEAAVLGKPTLVTRDVTERPEALEAGTALLVGPDPARLGGALQRLLADAAFHASMARPSGVFGDGHAADRIAEVLRHDLAAAPPA
ncbi:MAG: UDP-N-acetylglucosamine 2-epimerase (non-hydrolyzing) [Deltaproteobacteria bacterium]|nr:UDP-N-acetylglucosamine 2-epimerase (non-hydrolyzing) [Deltaproteobacteria bacterium]